MAVAFPGIIHLFLKGCAEKSKAENYDKHIGELNF